MALPALLIGMDGCRELQCIVPDRRIERWMCRRGGNVDELVVHAIAVAFQILKPSRGPGPCAPRPGSVMDNGIDIEAFSSCRAESRNKIAARPVKRRRSSCRRFKDRVERLARCRGHRRQPTPPSSAPVTDRRGRTPRVRAAGRTARWSSGWGRPKDAAVKVRGVPQVVEVADELATPV